jgi:multimeric flavodoxin WrbA
MRVLFITGSARDDSITAKLCGIAASAMPDADVTFIRTHELRIEHCKGCGSCIRTGGCVIDDDMHHVYDAVEKSDIVILATPIYFSGPTSILKQAVDRFHPVWVKDRGRNKGKIASLIAAGGDTSPVFSGTVSVAKAFAMTIGAEWTDGMTVGGTDGMTAIPDDIVIKAKEFGKRIVAAYLR